MKTVEIKKNNRRNCKDDRKVLGGFIMNAFQSNQTVGDIVAIMPKAGDIFKQYRIDFCCGGNKPLSEAIREKDLSEPEIMAKLNEAFEETRQIKEQKDFRNMTAAELTQYIENTHHVFVKSALPRLSDLTVKILRAHGANHEELFKVHKLFHELRTELEQHLIKEEEILFPLIRDYEANPSEELKDRIQTVMREKEDEHDRAGGILKELRRLTNDYAVPEDGCQTFFDTFERLKELESDLFMHIHLENNILFKGLKSESIKLIM